MSLLPEALERLVAHFVKLPGVGGKSARRMVFHLLSRPPHVLSDMADALAGLHTSLSFCPECGNIAQGGERCRVCGDALRDHAQVCVVENIEALVSFEQAGIYNGMYFVLSSRVSPLDDEEISDDDIARLRARVEKLGAREVIVAASPRIEGDLTWQALKDALRAELPELKVTRLAFGLPVGGSIEFADRVTLHTAFDERR